jgi:hypothetical protein
LFNNLILNVGDKDEASHLLDSSPSASAHLFAAIAAPPLSKDVAWIVRLSM